jgi:photosystem II stability/assembly factor-like uncharacterized protein
MSPSDSEHVWDLRPGLIRPWQATTLSHMNRLKSTVLITLTVAVLAATTFSAAPVANVDEKLLQELRFRLIGPFRGGRVLAVAGVPGEREREHFYFGSVNGGVWETDDAGRTWIPIFDGQPVGSIGAIAVSPSSPRVLYVGTGEADMRSDIAQGNGVYKTTDGGRSWTHLGLESTRQIARILVDPRDPERVFVAALGHPYGANPERGVFRSTDGGKTWQKVLYKNEDTGAIEVAFEPGNPDVLYAALWQTRRPPWSVYPPSNGPGSELFQSTDGGSTWSTLEGHGLPAKHGRIGLAVARSEPRRVYAMVDAAGEGGLYRSDDAGASWTRQSGDPRIWGRGWYFGGVTVAPRNADVVYACNTNVYRSEDGGRTFVPIKGAPGGDDYHELWIDPDHPERRMLAVDQGALVSLNAGETWSSWFNQPTAQMYHVVTDERFPYRVYGAQQDSGAAIVPSRTGTIDGITMMEFREITAGGESDTVAPDPNDPDIVYGGRVERLDLRTEQTQSIDPKLAFPDVARTTWTLPLIFSHRDSRVLYFARERLFRTEDGGRQWTAESPDLTREDPGTPPTLDPVTAADAPRPGRRHGVIYSIAPSRVADHDVWIGTDDGLVWRTRDEGEHWDNVTPKELTPWSKVGVLETSHFDAGTAYAAVDRHRLDDDTPYIYRTHDSGKSWTLASGGIAKDSFVNAVREDPERKGLLYAGTERGVYVSFDDGDHWQSLQLNLPVTSVRDLEVHGNDLVIATHGRGFWILDDVSPLRQIDDATPAGPGSFRLLAPAAAVRLRPTGFTGTPLQKDEPMAENPPYGAFIDYLIGGETRGPVVLSIFDARDELVRSYSSADPTPMADPATMRTAPQWFVRRASLSTEPGMHRFVWSLHYPPAAAALATDADGVWAPPGRYRVELSVSASVNGATQSEPLVVEPDPRVSLGSEAYAEQFSLARRIDAVRARVLTAVKEAEDLHRALSSRGATELDREVRALTGPQFGELAPVPPPPGIDSLRSLRSRLDELLVAVDGADAAPTPDARTGFAATEPGVQATLAAWEALRGKAGK